MIDVYKLELTDLNPPRKAYLLLKYQKQKNLKVDIGGKYLIDKIKLVINKKGEIVLISTHLTVLIQYQMIREESEDSYDISQDEETYYYADGQNKKHMKDEDQ